MGVDQSYTSSGIVILDEQSNIILFETKKTVGDDMFARSWEIASHLQAIARHFNVQTIGLEGLAFAKFGNATRDLAGLQYAIINNLRFISMRDVKIISPNALKKYATGKGNVKKQEMVDFLPDNVLNSFQALYKKSTGLYDVADAYWIAKYVLEQRTKEENNQIASRKSEENFKVYDTPLKPKHTTKKQIRDAVLGQKNDNRKQTKKEEKKGHEA